MGYQRRAAGGGGNATVPNDAPIQPPQAFVDAMTIISSAAASGTGVFPRDFHLENRGITHVATPADVNVDHTLLDFIYFQAFSAGNGLLRLYLQGNALPAADVDGILYEAKYHFDSIGGADGGVIDLSGGTTASPTEGLVNDELLALFAGGWTIKIKIHGVTVIADGAGTGDGHFNCSGNSLSAAEVNALLAALVAGYPNLAKTVDISGGTNAAPTGQGITDKNTLITNDWTVTTN